MPQERAPKTTHKMPTRPPLQLQTCEWQQKEARTRRTPTEQGIHNPQLLQDKGQTGENNYNAYVGVCMYTNL